MAKNPQLPGFNKAASKTPSGVGTSARGAPKNREAGPQWRCHTCGELQKYWARAERHADEQRHHRIEVIL